MSGFAAPDADASFWELPYLDEHALDVDAPPEAAWAETERLVRGLLSTRGARVVARLMGATTTTVSGPVPAEVGTTLPAFRVIAATPGRELALAGEHHLSRYVFIVRFDERPEGRSRVRVETRAIYPGFAGRVYKAIMIYGRLHPLWMFALLRIVRRRSERVRSRA